MKIAVFGGNFDPPHIGHLLAAQTIKKTLNIDQIWLLPFYKPLPVTSNRHRLEMVKLLEDATLKVSDFALQNKLIHDPMMIQKKLVETYPHHSFYWVSGSDHIQDIEKTFLAEQKIIIYSCGDTKAHIEEQVKNMSDTQSIPNTMFILSSEDFPTIDIASTHIRKKIQRNESIRGLLSKKIEEYIQQHNLYQ